MSALAATQTDDMPPPAPAPAARETETILPMPDLEIAVEERAGMLFEAAGSASGAKAEKLESARVLCGSQTTIDVSVQWKWNDRPGNLSFAGAEVVAGHNAALALNEEIWERDLSEKFLGPRMQAAMELGTLRPCIGNDGSSTLAEWRPTAYFCRTCESCDGDGSLPCRGCGARGVVACWSFQCHHGKVSCYSCGQTGKIRYNDGSVHGCHSCGSSGWTNCTTCGGNTVVRCDSCRGACHFDCSPCGTTGAITQVHGFGLKMEHKTKFWHGQMAGHEDAVAWMRQGSKGHADADPSGSQPTMRFSKSRVAVSARAPGKTPTFRYSVEGSVAQSLAEGTHEGVEWGGWCTMLDGKRFGFLPFLDEHVKGLASKLVDLAGRVAPSGFRCETARYGALGTILTDCQRSGATEAQTAAELDALFCGAATPAATAAVAKSQKSCIERFGDTAARAGWKWPMRLLVAASAAPFVMDLPWVAFQERDPAPAAVGAAATVAVIVMLLLIAEAIGRRAVRREVGSSKLFRPNIRRRRLALGAAALCAVGIMSPRFGLEASEFRAATHEFRTIIGLPHLNCMQPRAKVVADGCSIGQ